MKQGRPDQTPPRTAARPERLPLVRLLPALALLAAGGCGGGAPSPTASSPSCRQWMRTVVSSTGTSWECTSAGATASCSAFPASLTTTWTYASLDDFVREAAVPNRLLVLSKKTVGCGTFAYLGCTDSTTEYTYDGQGRLVRRERSSGSTLSEERTADVTTYSAWDAHGRPTAGEVAAGGVHQPLGISYDDVTRVMEATNGELVKQDQYGNTVREVEKWGVSDTPPPSETSYRIESLQSVCAP